MGMTSCDSEMAVREYAVVSCLAHTSARTQTHKHRPYRQSGIIFVGLKSQRGTTRKSALHSPKWIMHHKRRLYQGVHGCRHVLYVAYSNGIRLHRIMCKVYSGQKRQTVILALRQEEIGWATSCSAASSIPPHPPARNPQDQPLLPRNP